MPAPLAPSSLLTELSELREATRRSSTSWWFPMVAFGIVGLGGAVVSVASAGIQIVWWCTAVVAALALTGRFYRRRCAAQGVVPKYRRYWSLSVAMTAAAFAGPLLAPGYARAAAAWAVVAIGYVAAAGLARSVWLAVLGATLFFAVGSAVVLSAPASTADLACGVILIAGGLVARTVHGGP